MIEAITAVLVQFGESTELNVLCKVTVLLAAGLAAQYLARRRSAYIRHLMLTAAVGAALALPLIVITAPVVPVYVSASRNATPLAAEGHETVSLRTTSNRPDIPAGSQPENSPVSLLPSVATVLRLAWVTGSAVVFLSFALDILRMRRVRRDGLPCPRLEAALAKIAAERGIRRRVELLLHPDIGGPLTCGLLHPAILLPEDAERWSAQDLRRALLHEIEHIRRADWGVHLIVRVTSALYWFHPLVWIAERKLSLEAERACDDAVIDREENTAYAEQLVSLARRLTNTSAQVAIGMARRSDLSARVHAVLDKEQSRGRSSALAVGSALAVAVIAVVTIGPVRALAQSTGPGGRLAAMQEELNRSSALDQALFQAAERGDASGVSQLLAAGARVNAKIGGDGSPLIGAARNGHDQTVALLLDRGADPNMAVRGDGSPLIMAAENGHLSTVRLLLDRGADVRMPVPGDGNPLIMAARGGDVAVVELLLNRGADIEQVVPGDENALIEASASGHLAVVKLLIQRGANINSRVWVEPSGDTPGEWRTPLGMARRNNHTAVVNYLRSAGAHE